MRIFGRTTNARSRNDLKDCCYGTFPVRWIKMHSLSIGRGEEENKRWSMRTHRAARSFMGFLGHNKPPDMGYRAERDSSHG